MTESKRKQLLFGVFIAAIIFGLVTKPWERRRSPRPAEDDIPATESVSEATATSGTTYHAAAGMGIRFTTAWPSDPFGRRDATTPVVTEKPVVPGTKNEPLLKLQGIMHVDGKPVCIISRRTFAVGETVDGWKVAAIENEDVLLARGARRLRLTLR